MIFRTFAYCSFFVSLLISNSFARWLGCDPHSVDLDYDQSIKDGRIIVKNRNDKLLGATRDQGKIGYCFAYGAADILEHWMKSKKMMPEDENISAVGMGITYEELQYDMNKFKDRALKRPGKIKELSKANDELKSYEEKRDKLEKRYKQIEKLSGKEYDDSKDKIDSEFNKVVFNINRIQDFIEDTNKTFKAPLSIPEGGYLSKAIRLAWIKNVICYESEVSSRDSLMESTYNKYKSELNSMMFTPTDIKSTQSYLLESIYGDFDGGSCSVYNMASAMFPSVGQNQEAVLSFLKNDAIKRKNPLMAIVKKYCSNKKNKMFKPRVTALSRKKKLPNDIEVSNRDLMYAIDRELKNNKVVGVHYNSALLSGLGDSSSGGAHVSSIVGDVEICGEGYFILRNSWGDAGCLTSMLTHTPLYKPYNADQPLSEYTACNKKAKEMYEKKVFPECTNSDDACKKKYSSMTKACSTSYIKSTAKIMDLPFTCDTKGNFIIKKDYFKQGLARVEYIDNY